MSFKFEKLDVWQMSLDYADSIYELADKLPESEKYNLKSQIIRAATSISLNIAEGSTGQSDPEQNRSLGMAIRSLIETVACQRIIVRRKYITDINFMQKIDIEQNVYLHSEKHLLHIQKQLMKKRFLMTQKYSKNSYNKKKASVHCPPSIVEL
jgi:four helix bundle protein